MYAAIGMAFTTGMFGSTSTPSQIEPTSGGSTAMVGVTSTSKSRPNCAVSTREASCNCISDSANENDEFAWDCSHVARL